MMANLILDNYLKKIANGNKSALENLYLKTENQVYIYALSILRNRSLAQEVVQDVYIKIWDSIDTYVSKDKPMAWILTITKNAALMKIRKEQPKDDIDLYKDILGNSNNLDDKLFLSYLFSKVTEEERNIIFLHIVSGLKHKEIADMLSIPLGTVLSKYKRTLSKLQKIGKDGFSEEY